MSLLSAEVGQGWQKGSGSLFLSAALSLGLIRETTAPISPVVQSCLCDPLTFTEPLCPDAAGMNTSLFT